MNHMPFSSVPHFFEFIFDVLITGCKYIKLFTITVICSKYTSNYSNIIGR